MSIRARIFAVIGAVVAAAFVQTLVVVSLEGRRVATRDAMDKAIWRYQSQSEIQPLVADLDSAQRAFLITGRPASRQEYNQRWEMYVQQVSLLPQYIDEPAARKELADLAARIHDWHQNVSLVLMDSREKIPDIARALDEMSLPRMRQIRALLNRFEQGEKERLSEQRQDMNTQYLQTTLLTLALPAVTIVMLLVLVAILARILLDPLAAVAESARQISGGNFDVTLPAAARDEIGALVRAFRDMTSAVQRRQRDLTDALSREREISQMYAALRTKAEHEHARLQAVIATVPAALMILEAPGGRIVMQNTAADMLLGREPDEDDERQAYWENFRAAYRDGTPCSKEDWGPRQALRGDVVVGQELIVKPPDGRTVPILISAAPLRNESGTIIGAVAAVQDITNLYEIDRLKSEFVSVVSHELRTPLTSIKGALQLLLDEVPLSDPDHRTLMDVALSNTDRLVRIINDILDISKIEAGKLELNQRPCDVAELVRLSVQSVAQIAADASVTLTPMVPPAVPKVLADPDRTIQAIVNLLSNALKYAPPGSDVILEVRPRADRSVALSVIDRGRGIPAEKLGQLFQKFQQIDGADTRRFRGTGLGLAITKALIEMQGGSVGVSSEVDKGSTFTITLPGLPVQRP